MSREGDYDGAHRHSESALPDSWRRRLAVGRYLECLGESIIKISLQYCNRLLEIGFLTDMLNAQSLDLSRDITGEGGWQWVLNHLRIRCGDVALQYRERIIFLGQYIDEEFGNQVVATMLYLDSIDNTKPMYLYINCPGGDVRRHYLHSSSF